MDDLAAFLAARLDEDEAAARPMAARYAEWKKKPRDWTRLMCDPVVGAFGGQSALRDVARGLYVGDMSDPDRVLREVAAKRAILAAHRAHRYEGPYPSTPTCTVCITERKGYQEEWDDDEWPCATLRHLAAVYSDHPGYRQEWRP